MADLTTVLEASEPSAFTALLQFIGVYIGITLPFSVLWWFGVSLWIIISVLMGKSNDARERQTVWTFILMLPISWIAVPLGIALYWVLYLSAGETTWAWNVFPATFIDLLKGWTILSLDLGTALPIALVLWLSSQKIQDWADRRAAYYFHRGGRYVNELVSKASYYLFIWAQVMYLAITGTLLIWTVINVLVFASKYGFFERHGGIGDFFYCYAYTLFLLLATAEYMFLMAGVLAGLAGTVYMIYQSVQYLYRMHEEGWPNSNYLSLMGYVLGSVLTACIGTGLCFAWIYDSVCAGMKTELMTAIAGLYKPGHLNQTLDWTVISNVTGNYNITQAPHRPPLPPPGIGPLGEEFRCSMNSAYQLLPFLAYAAGGASFYGLAWSASTIWKRRRAMAEGKAYEMMSSDL